MKNLQEKILWPFIAAVFAGLVVLWMTFRAQPHPQVVFSLPQPLEYRQKVGQDESPLRLQQLEITNVGEAPAKNIVIKFIKPILNPDIKKFSEADKPEIFLQKLPYEIRYPELPPRTNFKVVFSSPNGALEPKDLIIKHSDGDGEEVTVAAQPKSTGRLLTLISNLALAFQLIGLLYVLKSVLSTLHADKLDEKLVDLLKYEDIHNTFKKKPWYISKRDRDRTWLRITRDNLWEISKYSLQTKNVTKSSMYHLLNDDRPDFVSADNWREMSEFAHKRFEAWVKGQLEYSYKSDQVLDLCRLPRPRFLTQDAWNQLVLLISNECIKIFSQGTEYDIVKAHAMLKQKKPDGVSDASWQKIQNDVKKNYATQVESTSLFSENPVATLKEFDLDVLSQDEANSLRQSISQSATRSFWNKLCREPKPLEALKSLDLKGFSEEQIQYLRDQAYLEQKNRLVPSVTDSKALAIFVSNGKPDWLLAEDFAMLEDANSRYKEIYERLNQQEKSLEEAILRSKAEKDKYELRVRAVRRLIVANRLEEQFADVFEADEWENLELISKALAAISTNK